LRLEIRKQNALHEKSKELQGAVTVTVEQAQHISIPSLFAETGEALVLSTVIHTMYLPFSIRSVASRPA
jgi:hypothetical protein